MMTDPRKQILEALLVELSPEAELKRLISAAEARLAKIAKAKARVDPRTGIKTCPKCGHQGPGEADFGIKEVAGVVRVQSWCKSCRARTKYAPKPKTDAPSK